MPICQTCNIEYIEYDEGTRFCKQCGTRLVAAQSPAALHCPQCHIAYEPGRKFCKHCGASL